MKKAAAAAKKMSESEVAASKKMKAASDRLTKSKKQQADALQGIKDKLGLLANPYVAITAAVTALTAVTVRAISNQIEYGDSLDKIARRVGITVEALQGLRFAADISGVTVQDLEKSIRSLARRSAEATIMVRGEFAKGFRALGVEVQDADGKLKSVEQLLPEIADGLAGMATQGDRTSAAMRVLGISGTKLLPMLQTGSADLKALTTRMAGFGLMTTEQSQNLAKLKDQLLENSLAFQGLKNEIFGTNTALGWMITKVTRAAQGWNLMLKMGTLLKSVFRGNKEETQRLAKEFESFAKAMGQTTQKQDKAAAATERYRLKMLGLQVRMKAVGDTAEKAAEKTRKAWAKAFDKSAAEADNWISAQIERQSVIAAAENELTAALTQAWSDHYNEITALGLKEASEFKQAQEEKAAFALQTANTIGAAFGAAAASMIQDQEDAGKAIISASLDVANQVINMAIAKAMAEAVAGTSGIPIIGIALGAVAAASVMALIKGLTSGMFAEGGIVTGGRKGEDSVLAMLTPGELVVPVAQVAQMKRLFGSPSSGAPAPQPVRLQGGGTVPGGAPARTMNVILNMSFLVPPNRAQLDRYVRDTVAPALRRLDGARL